MNPPIFISYARKVSRDHAVALHRALGGDTGLAFLDTQGTEPGEYFPRKLADALLASRVVVVFASKDYFRRWYCLWELEAALAPFLALGPGMAQPEKEAALVPLVLALPPEGAPSLELLPVPPALRAGSWPHAEDTSGLEALVRERLARSPRTLGERLEGAGGPGAGLRTRLLDKAASRPEPRNLAGARMSPRTLPPSLGDGFVGRADELWRIHYTLSVLQDRRGEGVAGAALTGALQGAGGFGKTRLALEYLHRLGPGHYPGGLFWVNAEGGPDRLEEQFHGILRTLVPDVPELAEFREKGRSAERELGGALGAVAARERVLYVVDNVPEPGPEEEPAPLGTWCPALGKVSLLATSRARLDLGTEGVYALPVSVLTPEAAVALLTEGLPRTSLSEDAWSQIAEWVGYLPLALELLNRAMRAKALEPPELLSRAQEQGPVRELEHQVRMLRRHVPKGSLRGVIEAFALSYGRLEETEQRVARLIAQLAPAPIPLELLKALEPEDSSGEVRTTLWSRHFVVPVEKSDVGMSGGMHRVLADYLRGLSPDALAELRQVGQGLVTVMDRGEYRELRNWPLMEAYLPHAERVFRRLQESGGPSEGELNLGLCIGRLLSERGLAGRARAIEEEIVARAQAAFGTEHPLTLRAVHNLASTRQDQGDYAGARELQEKVLEVRRRVLGEEHPDTLSAMGNLASTRRGQGDHAGARELREKVLEVSRRVLGEEHPDTLSAMGNLATTRGDQGDRVGARQMYEKGLEVMRRVRGEEHLDTLVAMNNLALARRDQGDNTGAWELQEKVLEMMRRVLGEEHPDTLLAMGNLAGTRRLLGDHAGARELEEKALEVMRRVLGAEHPHTLLVMHNLASTRQDQGDYAGARELQEKVLEVSRRVLGEEHPHTLLAMLNLAHTRREQGDHAGARELQETALEVSRRVLGEEHPHTLLAMHNLATTRRLLGDHAGAPELQEKVLEVMRRVLGEEHPGTLVAMGDVAATRRLLGDPAGARELQEKVLEVRRRVLGEEHPDTLSAMGHLASTRLDQGDYAEAPELQEKVLEGMRRVLGEEHQDTLMAMHNLARTRWAQGDHTAARELQEKVLEGMRRLLGEEHPDTILATHNLALTRFDQGDSAGARELQEEVLEVRRRMLGEEHPGTLTAMHNLAHTRWAQRDHAGARELEEKVLEVMRRVLGEEHQDTLMVMDSLALMREAQGDIAGAQELEEEALEVRQRVLGEEHPDALMLMEELETPEPPQQEPSSAESNHRWVLPFLAACVVLALTFGVFLLLER